MQMLHISSMTGFFFFKYKCLFLSLYIKVSHLFKLEFIKHELPSRTVFGLSENFFCFLYCLLHLDEHVSPKSHPGVHSV